MTNIVKTMVKNNVELISAVILYVEAASNVSLLRLVLLASSRAMNALAVYELSTVTG